MNHKISREEYESAQKVLRILSEEKMCDDFSEHVTETEAILRYIKPDYVNDPGIMDEIEREFAML